MSIFNAHQIKYRVDLKHTIIVSVGMFAIVSSPIHAQAQTSLVDQIRQCGAIKTNAERLFCFDKIVADEIAQPSPNLGHVPATTPRTITPSVSRESERVSNIPKIESPISSTETAESRTSRTEKEKIETFGKPDKTTALSLDNTYLDEDGTAVFTLQKAQLFNPSKYRFFMTNGQVWEQTQSKDIRIPKIREKSNVTAHVSKASFGSEYFLRINGKGRSLKVKRVR